VAGLSCYEYPAAFHLVLWGLFVAALKIALPSAGRRSAFRLAAGFVAGAALGLAPMALGLQGTVQAGRTATVGAMARHAPLAGHLVPFANLFVNVGAAPVQWANHPAGHARLSWLERAELLGGLAGLFAMPGVPAIIRASLGIWLPLALSPEAVPGELQLSRGVGALAPLALLAGLAGTLVARRFGRRALLAVLVAGLLNAGWSGWHLYGPYAHDPLVMRAWQWSDREAGVLVARLCRDGPVRIPAANWSYENGAIMRVMLWNEIRRGLVIPMTMHEADLAGFRPTVDFIRHPVTGEPDVFVLGTSRYFADRTLCLMNHTGLMETGRRFEAAGRLADAEGYYRYILSLFPDSYRTRMVLGRFYRREGRIADAQREFAAAGYPGFTGP
jgi:hypothetical protein